MLCSRMLMDAFFVCCLVRHMRFKKFVCVLYVFNYTARSFFMSHSCQSAAARICFSNIMMLPQSALFSLNID